MSQKDDATDDVASGTLNRLLNQKLPRRSLEDRAPNLPVEDQIALSDADVRRKVTIWIMGLFGAVNSVTLVLLIGLAWVDQVDLTRGLIKAADRLVNSQVLIALLGATSVQLGSIAVIMAKFVFKADG